MIAFASKMMSKFRFIMAFSVAVAVASSSLLSSCGKSGDGELRTAVDSFSTAYFNWQFARALPFADDASRQWIAFAASQVTQEDVDTLRSMSEGASVEVKDVRYEGDSAAVAVVGVSHFVALDTIGRPPHTIEKATFHLPVVCRNGEWKVALRSLPKRQR